LTHIFKKRLELQAFFDQKWWSKLQLRQRSFFLISFKNKDLEIYLKFGTPIALIFMSLLGS